MIARQFLRALIFLLISLGLISGGFRLLLSDILILLNGPLPATIALWRLNGEWWKPLVAIASLDSSFPHTGANIEAL